MIFVSLFFVVGILFSVSFVLIQEHPKVAGIFLIISIIAIILFGMNYGDSKVEVVGNGRLLRIESGDIYVEVNGKEYKVGGTLKNINNFVVERMTAKYTKESIYTCRNVVESYREESVGTGKVKSIIGNRLLAQIDNDFYDCPIADVLDFDNVEVKKLTGLISGEVTYRAVSPEFNKLENK